MRRRSPRHQNRQSLGERTLDITYVATAEGFLYLALILDVYSRRVVGCAMGSHLRTELVVEALSMAY